MTALRVLAIWTGVGVLGGWLVLSGWMQSRPPLARVVAHLRRADTEAAGTDTPFTVLDLPERLGRSLVDIGLSRWIVLPDAADLRLTGRTPARHLGSMVVLAVVAALVPILLLGVLHATGTAPLGWFVPLVCSICAGVAAPALLHAQVVERARARRLDLRHQLSAYLDVVIMMLAGNSGHEGALHQAASAGDGRLFRELRRRMREATSSGRSLVHALEATGVELGLVELRQVAATTSLSAAEGSPVARTLAAKCATLRSTLATEQEAEARLRTSRLTAPLVGMALIFMALVIYPALSLQ